jgi:hypothetical protein
LTAVEEERASDGARRFNGLRTSSLAAIVMLLIEFGLGVGVNIYAKLPLADSRKSLLPAFGRAVTSGPIVLTLHALLGTLLLITGISVVVRAARIRDNVLLAVASVALVAIIVAWLSGARFVGDAADGASLAMALAIGVTVLCYVIILFVAPRPAPLATIL